MWQFNKIFNVNQIKFLIFLILIKLQFVIKLIDSATIQCMPCDSIIPKSTTKTYEEFLFEHEVTKQEAIDALNRLNDSFFEGANKYPGCKAIPCTQKVIKYCLSSQFLNDHCWCEQGHGKEGLPWVPHTCYVGEKQYTASVGSCYFFNEVKECCCNQVLAKEWKYILSSSSRIQEHNKIIFIISLIIISIGCLFYEKIIFPT